MTIDEINKEIIIYKNKLDSYNTIINDLLVKESENISDDYSSLMTEVNEITDKLEYLISQIK